VYDPTLQKWVLIGNTSWGANGCDTSYPSAWSKNSAVADWIKTNTEGVEFCP